MLIGCGEKHAISVRASPHLYIVASPKRSSSCPTLENTKQNLFSICLTDKFACSGQHGREVQQLLEKCVCSRIYRGAGVREEHT